MFNQLFRYKILKLIRTKEELFWCLAFPIILGTMFYISFGDLSEKQEMFQTIKIGYIAQKSAMDETFDVVINELNEKETDALIQIETTNEEEAKQLLTDKKIAGIIYNQNELSLTVNGEGLNESILDSFLSQYAQKKATVSRIAMKSPEKMEDAIAILNLDSNYVKEISFSKSNPDSMTAYFYALIAMNCLYGCFAGKSIAIDIKANLSTLGARRIIAPTHKLNIILSDFFAAVLIQLACTMITVLYLIFGLKVDIGQNLLLLTLTALVGSIIGVATGSFIGSIGKASDKVKSSIGISLTMVECFLSGLMIGNMKDIVERYAPIVNRINPAALIVDSLYSLDIYDTYDRYAKNLVSMLILAGLLCIGSFWAIRRERYASI